MRVQAVGIAVLLALCVPALAQVQPPASPAERALMEASFTGKLDAVRDLLAEGASVNAADAEKRTSLMWAAFNGHTPVIALLLKNGARVNSKDSSGRTALMYASSGPFPETVKLLLEKGAEINLQGTLEGFTALMTAAAEGQVEVVRILLEHGADPKLADEDGDTAEAFALQKGHSEVAEMLRKPTPAIPPGVKTVRSLTLLALALVVCGVCGVTPLRAQSPEDELGNWLIYNGTIRFSDRWSMFTEAQLRLFEPASNVNEAFARVAGLYDLTPRTHIGAGYMRSHSYEFVGNDRETTEDRIYGQFDFKHDWRRAAFEHRYRYEWRSIDESTGDRDANRLRYRFQVTTPLGRDSLEPGTNFINAYDEIFINTRKPREFDQNRLYVAYGRQFTKMANLQLGLLWQARTSEDFYRLQIFYTHNFDLRK